MNEGLEEALRCQIRGLESANKELTDLIMMLSAELKGYMQMYEVANECLLKQMEIKEKLDRR